MFPAAASTAAPQVDALYIYLVVLSVVMTTLIFIAIGFFAYKYRRRSPEDPMPRAIHGSLPMEVTWSVIPFLFMLVMFAWGTKLYFENYTPPRNTLDIYVVGKQWMWKVQYPDGQREINELHIPVDRPVKLILTSEDVIHDFFVRELRTKQDIVPGMEIPLEIHVDRPGEYEIACAELCGLGHSQMRSLMIVMEAAAFDKWKSGMESAK